MRIVTVRYKSRESADVTPSLGLQIGENATVRDIKTAACQALNNTTIDKFGVVRANTELADDEVVGDTNEITVIKKESLHVLLLGNDDQDLGSTNIYYLPRLTTIDTIKPLCQTYLSSQGINCECENLEVRYDGRALASGRTFDQLENPAYRIVVKLLDNVALPPVEDSASQDAAAPSLSKNLWVGGILGAISGTIISTIIYAAMDTSGDLIFGVGVPAGLVLGLIAGGLSYSRAAHNYEQELAHI